jgi:2-dehydropantoate 2-reductase
VIGAAVYSSNDAAQPGVVLNHTWGRDMLVVGEIDDRPSERVAGLRAVLNAAGMHSPATGDIRQSIWDKLQLNFGSSLCVILGEPISAITGDPALRDVRARLVAEGEAIARAHGISFEGVPRRPGGAHGSGAGAHKPSMLQDYERGRPMEIESQLKAPLELARAARVATPTLDALVALAAQKAAAKGLYVA